MERQTGNGWYVGGYMLGPPESLRYRSVTILRIGRSAGNPFAESPQRPYAARPNARSCGTGPRVKRWSRPQRARAAVAAPPALGFACGAGTGGGRGRGNPVRQVNPEVLGSNPRRPTRRMLRGS